MITYTCAICKEKIVATRNNPEGIVRFDDKYWHKDCFIEACHKRMGNKKFTKYNWQDALDGIEQWQSDASTCMERALNRDDVYNFLTTHYRISCVNNALFTRLQAIYDGSYNGLLYAIPPEELLAQWEYYFPQLLETRKYKNMTDDAAVAYDLAVLLTKNAEYREIMAKKKVEEQARKAQEQVEINLNTDALIVMRNNRNKQQVSASRKRAELFKEVMGDGN